MGVVEEVEFKVSTMLQKGIITAGTAAAGYAATIIMKKFGFQMDHAMQAEIAVAVTGGLSMLRNFLKQKVSWLGWL